MILFHGTNQCFPEDSQPLAFSCFFSQIQHLPAAAGGAPGEGPAPACAEPPTTCAMAVTVPHFFLAMAPRHPHWLVLESGTPASRLERGWLRSPIAGRAHRDDRALRSTEGQPRACARPKGAACLVADKQESNAAVTRPLNRVCGRCWRGRGEERGGPIPRGNQDAALQSQGSCCIACFRSKDLVSNDESTPWRGLNGGRGGPARPNNAQKSQQPLGSVSYQTRPAVFSPLSMHGRHRCAIPPLGPLQSGASVAEAASAGQMHRDVTEPTPPARGRQARTRSHSGLIFQALPVFFQRN